MDTPLFGSLGDVCGVMDREVRKCNSNKSARDANEFFWKVPSNGILT